MTVYLQHREVKPEEWRIIWAATSPQWAAEVAKIQASYQRDLAQIEVALEMALAQSKKKRKKR